MVLFDGSSMVLFSTSIDGTIFMVPLYCHFYGPSIVLFFMVHRLCYFLLTLDSAIFYGYSIVLFLWSSIVRVFMVMHGAIFWSPHGPIFYVPAVVLYFIVPRS